MILKISFLKKKEIEENKFNDYLNRIGMDLNSQLKLDDFVDIIREKKLASIIRIKNQSEAKKIKHEEEEKNSEENCKTEEVKNNEEL